MDGLQKLVVAGFVILVGIFVFGIVCFVGAVSSAIAAFFAGGLKRLALIALAVALGYVSWSILGDNHNKKQDSLTKAILDKNPKRVERILKSGKNVNDSDIYAKKLYLETALDVNEAEIVRILLDYGARTDIPLSYRYPLSQAFIKGCDREITTLLIERDSPLNEECEPSFCTPLFFALLFDRTEEAEMLFEKGAEVDFRTRLNDGTILMCLLDQGNEKSSWKRDIGFVSEKAKWLIAHGADITLTDKNGKTALDHLHENFGSEEKLRAFEESGEIGTYRELEQLLTVQKESGTKEEKEKASSKPATSGTEITRIGKSTDNAKEAIIAKADAAFAEHTELMDIEDDW